jgi:hypothetical protein
MKIFVKIDKIRSRTAHHYRIVWVDEPVLQPRTRAIKHLVN